MAKTDKYAHLYGKVTSNSGLLEFPTDEFGVSHALQDCIKKTGMKCRSEEHFELLSAVLKIGIMHFKARADESVKERERAVAANKARKAAAKAEFEAHEKAKADE